MSKIELDNNKIKLDNNKIELDNNKIKIIKLFNENIKGKKCNLIDYNIKHCGKEGHWLEKQMNIKNNSKNDADLFGYEIKKDLKKK